jgi:hypothetical protein
VLRQLQAGAEIAQIHAEIDRLRSLVLAAVDVLGRAGRTDEAGWLRPGLDGL